MSQKIIILDFGSQYTQLIARRIRELNVYCEIHPYNQAPNSDEETIGLILSGSPCSVLDDNAPDFDLDGLTMPLLGICYGAQLFAKKTGGSVARSEHRELAGHTCQERMQIVRYLITLMGGVRYGCLMAIRFWNFLTNLKLWLPRKTFR